MASSWLAKHALQAKGTGAHSMLGPNYISFKLAHTLVIAKIDRLRRNKKYMIENKLDHCLYMYSE